LIQVLTDFFRYNLAVHFSFPSPPLWELFPVEVDPPPPPVLVFSQAFFLARILSVAQKLPFVIGFFDLYPSFFLCGRCAFENLCSSSVPQSFFSFLLDEVLPPPLGTVSHALPRDIAPLFLYPPLPSFPPCAALERV